MPLVFYLGLAALPLYFLVFRVKPDFGQEVLGVIKQIPGRLSKKKWIYLLVGLLFLTVLFLLASTYIATIENERNRWILDNNVPVLPVDVPIPARIALVFSWFTPTNIAIPLVNLLFILLWLVFLVYVDVGADALSLVAVLAFLVTVCNGVTYDALKANFELPAALLSFIGLYGIWRGKVNLGLFFLIIGGIFKNTGMFQVAAGAIFLAILCVQMRSVRKMISKIDITLLIFLIIYFIASQWGGFYYIYAVRSGTGYLLNPSPIQKTFWLSSFVTFVQMLASYYSLLLILGLIGGLLVPKNRIFFGVSFGILIFLRCFSIIAGNYYSMIFVPALSFFALFGIKALLGMFKHVWMQRLVVLLIIAISLVTLSGTLVGAYSEMTRLNSNFDEFISNVVKNFPAKGTIYQRNISLIPYLRDQGRNISLVTFLGTEKPNPDYDIEFQYYNENKTDVVTELAAPGCKLIVMQKNDLGISKEELLSLGYSDTPYALKDNSAAWEAYSRDCK